PDDEKRVTNAEAVPPRQEARRLTAGAYRAVDSASAEASTTERAQAQVEALVTRWAQDVMALGLEVKGLWLVDFDSGSGYYCWQYPEEGLQFFHTYEEGFRGRTRIH